MSGNAWWLVAVGAGFTGAGCYNALRSWRASAWSTARGEVVDSLVVEEYEDTDLDNNVSTTRTRYIPRVRYRYSVRGKEYVAERISFSAFRRWSEAGARKLVDRYEVGQEVTVRYAPREPGEAVLEMSGRLTTLGFIALGVVCVVAGAVLVRKGY
jgi:hypothetical protein